VASDWGNHYYVAHDNRIVISGGVVISNERRISSISNTASYGGHTYYAGPRRQEAERMAHTTITPASVRESEKPGRMQASSNAVSVYRPKINSGSKVYSRPANATPIEKMNSRQNARNNSPNRMEENRSSAPARNHSSQQLQPTYQPPQKTRKESGEVMHSSGRNTPPAQQHSAPPQQRQQYNMAPQQGGQQHNVAPQQGRPQQHPISPQQGVQHQHIQRQTMERQPAAPKQREQAPKQDQQKQEGRPKGNRY